MRRSSNHADPEYQPKLENFGEKEKIDPGSPTKRPIIEITNGCFGWDTKALVKDVNLSISKGEHIVVTGAVGSGKSLLLQAIVGETQAISGSVRKGDGLIAYCGQTPWLENSTARENATRGALDDNTWHERVIDACALRELFEAKAPGKTIGSNGALISGGERQRLVS